MKINSQVFLKKTNLEGDPRLANNLRDIQQKFNKQALCFSTLLFALSNEMNKADLVSFRCLLNIPRGVELNDPYDLFNVMKGQKDDSGCFTGQRGYLLSQHEVNALTTIIRAHEKMPNAVRRRLVVTILFYQKQYQQKIFDSQAGDKGAFVDDGKPILKSLETKKPITSHNRGRFFQDTSVAQSSQPPKQQPAQQQPMLSFDRPAPLPVPTQTYYKTKYLKKAAHKSQPPPSKETSQPAVVVDAETIDELVFGS